MKIPDLEPVSSTVEHERAEVYNEHSVIEDKLAIMYRNQEKIYTLLKLLVKIEEIKSGEQGEIFKRI